MAESNFGTLLGGWGLITIMGFILIMIKVPRLECNCVELLNGTTQAVCDTQTFLLPCPLNTTGVLCNAYSPWVTECGNEIHLAGIILLSIAAIPIAGGGLFLMGCVFALLCLGLWNGCVWVWNGLRQAKDSIILLPLKTPLPVNV